MVMDLTFYQLNNKQDGGQRTEISVTLTPKWMGIPRTEDPYWTCPSYITDGHGLFEVYFPRGKDDGIYMVIPCLYHMENFPKPINIGWGLVLVNLSSQVMELKWSVYMNYLRQWGHVFAS